MLQVPLRVDIVIPNPAPQEFAPAKPTVVAVQAVGVSRRR
jgi:hypothetical protein